MDSSHVSVFPDYSVLFSERSGRVGLCEIARCCSAHRLAGSYDLLKLRRTLAQ
jgi:hypothetical protein